MSSTKGKFWFSETGPLVYAVIICILSSLLSVLCLTLLCLFIAEMRATNTTYDTTAYIVGGTLGGLVFFALCIAASCIFLTFGILRRRRGCLLSYLIYGILITILATVVVALPEGFYIENIFQHINAKGLDTSEYDVIIIPVVKGIVSAFTLIHFIILVLVWQTYWKLRKEALLEDKKELIKSETL